MYNIILFGCGALGTRLLRVLENDYAALNVVGAIDTAPNLAGSTLGSACNSGRFADVTISPDLDSCLAGLETTPAAFIHMTESKPARIEAQLHNALDRGMNVISAAESMFYPGLRFPDFSARLDARAKELGLTVTGMGINPGFSYDTVPLLLARSTSAISAIRIKRTIDVTGTGPGDIEHVGYGLTPEDFRAGVERGDIVGHMGAPESLALLAEYLDMELDLVTESWDLQTAEMDVDSGDPTLGILPPGRVVGITQHAKGHADGKVVLQTSLSMFYRPETFGLTECDEIEIDGNMPVRMRIEPALESLFGASNVLASTIVPAIEAAPGLLCGLDLPVATHRSDGRYAVDSSRDLKPGHVPLTRTRG
ncbi:hypothetical protein [Pelagovum pacificum]|uniref:2,4-diaminopentanoate dehydrogenase C-terminal domain-containing protein n=1 Tax=Pelagovum pacificum TaxID=2588711 RepID=A0A5C5G748_9RHOB|nr:hypothetical protein [Pelagovum pacificum]QQA41986.1 hypothetical protein I8N54_14445 [Pelagovum pacificum]TNY30573.1 hypothetical protein FHY64_18495 [Pelagovum pacificum]